MIAEKCVFHPEQPFYKYCFQMSLSAGCSDFSQQSDREVARLKHVHFLIDEWCVSSGLSRVLLAHWWTHPVYVNGASVLCFACASSMQVSPRCQSGKQQESPATLVGTKDSNFSCWLQVLFQQSGDGRHESGSRCWQCSSASP